MKFLKKFKKKIIFIYLVICSILPFNYLRIIFYNLAPGINIKNSQIGFLNIFITNQISIHNSYLGNFNLIKINKLKIINSSLKNFNLLNNFYKFYINKKTIIGSYNIFNNTKYKKNFFVAIKSQISSKIFIEMDTNIICRENVVFGGRGSKIINNRSNLKRTFFNKNIYVGSKVLITSGVSIKGCGVTIGACSVVNTDILKPGKYFSKKIKLINEK